MQKKRTIELITATFVIGLAFSSFAGENVLKNGNFELGVNEKGQPKNWISYDKDGVELVEENGNTVLQITNADPKKSINIQNFVEIGKNWIGFKVMAKMKAVQLAKGDKEWKTAKINIFLADAEQHRIGNYYHILLEADSDWVEKEITVRRIRPEKGKKAVYVGIRPALNEATGLFQLDDIQLIPLEAQK